MSEYLGRDLPLEVYEDDLRFVLPELFERYAAQHGWDASIENGVDDNHYKARYVLVRPIPASFDDGELIELESRIGVVDEMGGMLDDYDLWVERIGDELEPDEEFPIKFITETNRLFYEFNGFPTDKTMETIQKLIEEFPPEEKKSRWSRALGYFALKKRYRT